jgi:TM2 domain-containing membrane protein YozV
MSGARRNVAVHALIGLLLFLSFGALAGGGALLADPAGQALGLPVALLAGTPFLDYFIPGVLLFTFLGVYPAAVSFALWSRPNWQWPELLNPFRLLHWAWTAGFSVGIVLLVWILSQMMLLGCCYALQYLYLGWGILILIVAAVPAVRGHYRRAARLAGKDDPIREMSEAVEQADEVDEAKRMF